jgi:uracil-DNA glycosylase
MKSADLAIETQGMTRAFGGVNAVENLDLDPAYLLRNPAAKRDVWEDMKVVRALLDRP